MSFDMNLETQSNKERAQLEANINQEKRMMMGAHLVMSELEMKRKYKSAHLDHYLSLFKEGRINTDSVWGCAHVFAIVRFVCRDYSSSISYETQQIIKTLNKESMSFYERTVPKEIREGDHWDKTSNRCRRMSGLAEDLWASRQEI